MEERASELLGFKGKAVITEFAEIGMDVDKEADWLLMEACLGESPDKYAVKRE